MVTILYPIQKVTIRKNLIRFFTDDFIVASVIVLNAIVLFLLSFDELLPYAFWLELIDAFFLGYFVLEAYVKIRVQGWKPYIRQGWNRFDFTIVLFGIPSIVLLFYSDTPDHNLAFVFAFRVIRLIRFIRFFRFIPNLDELTAGVKRAFKASIFVFIAFFVYGFIIALISSRLFKDLSPELFGNPVKSFYSTFKVFSIEGWYEVPEKIIRHARLGGMQAFFTKLYFILIVITGGIFGLSIVNAIFVEEMVRDNNDELENRVQEMDQKIDRLLAGVEALQTPLPTQEEPQELNET